MTFGERGLFGGGERYPLELARAMARLIPTTLVTFGPERMTETIEGLKVEVLPTRTIWRGSEVNPLSEALIPSLLSADVVHVHQWESVVANICVVVGRALGKRVYATDHGGSGRNYWRRGRLHRPLNGFLSVSGFAASFYPELADKFTVIYGGVDTALYRPLVPSLTAPVGASHVDHRDRRALFVGRLLPHKGIDVLIQALDAGTPLQVIGRAYDSAFRDHLHRLARGKDVTFEENADDEHVRQAYRRARVVVLPSLHHPPAGPPAPKSELLGLVLLEAMASGTPVVCTRTGGMPEVVVEGVTGFVTDPAEPGQLTYRIRQLLSDDQAWSRMSAQARQHTVERYSWNAVAQRCLHAYQGRPEKPKS